jgi:hypothetical protein
MKFIFNNRASFNQALAILNREELMGRQFDVGYADMIISFFERHGLRNALSMFKRDGFPLSSFDMETKDDE